MLQKRVIIVEDNAITSSMLKEIIEVHTNWKVIEISSNGESGIDVIERYKPDLVLLDLLLPGCDGFSVMKKVRERDIDCKFFVISGVKEEFMISKALSHGASYYLAKPFDTEILVERMCDLFGTSAPKKENNPTVGDSYNHWLHLVDQKVFDFFVRLGLPATQKGFGFLRTAMLLCVKKPEMLSNISGNLYPAVAKHYRVNDCVIERGIRNALATAWQRGCPENFSALFKCDAFSEFKPTNGEFLRLYTTKILMDAPCPNASEASSWFER